MMPLSCRGRLMILAWCGASIFRAPLSPLRSEVSWKRDRGSTTGLPGFCLYVGEMILSLEKAAKMELRLWMVRAGISPSNTATASCSFFVALMAVLREVEIPSL